YRGRDGEERWTELEWSDPPVAASAASSRFEYVLLPQAPQCLSLAIRCERTGRAVAPRSYEAALDDALAALETARGEYAVLESSSERVNQWVRRSAADLRM